MQASSASKSPAPWEVWLAYVRFADHPDVGKVRPVVIIDERAAAIVVAKVTSAEPQERFSYCELVDWVREGLLKLGIDSLGLERYDREILSSIINNFSGGPVGAETLAISIGESQDTLEDYYEPYLIQCGLLQRTPRGRVVTDRAYAHLGLERRGGGDEDQRLLF